MPKRKKQQPQPDSWYEDMDLEKELKRLKRREKEAVRIAEGSNMQHPPDKDYD